MEVYKHYSVRWHCSDTVYLPRIIEFLSEREGILRVPDDVFAEALWSGRPTKLDSDGICPTRLKLVADSQPQAVKHVIFSLLASTEQMTLL